MGSQAFNPSNQETEEDDLCGFEANPLYHRILQSPMPPKVLINNPGQFSRVGLIYKGPPTCDPSGLKLHAILEDSHGRIVCKPPGQAR